MTARTFFLNVFLIEDISYNRVSLIKALSLNRLMKFLKNSAETLKKKIPL